MILPQIQQRHLVFNAEMQAASDKTALWDENLLGFGFLWAD